MQKDHTNETPEERARRVETTRRQVAALLVLGLHKGMDPRDINQEQLDEEARHLAGESRSEIKDVRYAADGLLRNPEKMEQFLKLAENDTDVPALAEFLNPVSEVEQRLELQQSGRMNAAPSSDVILTCMQSAALYYYDPVIKIAANPTAGAFDQESRDTCFRGMQRFTAYNKLIYKNPGRLYFTDREYREALRQVQEDKTLKAQFDQHITSHGDMRKYLWYFGGGAQWIRMAQIQANADNALLEQANGENADTLTVDIFKNETVFRLA